MVVLTSRTIRDESFLSRVRPNLILLSARREREVAYIRGGAMYFKATPAARDLDNECEAN